MTRLVVERVAPKPLTVRPAPPTQKLVGSSTVEPRAGARPHSQLHSQSGTSPAFAPEDRVGDTPQKQDIPGLRP